MNFKFKKIGNTGIFLGNNPITDTEVKQLAFEGIKAVLSIESDNNAFEYVKQLYTCNGIRCVTQIKIPEFNNFE